jgi:hypothetical protein
MPLAALCVARKQPLRVVGACIAGIIQTIQMTAKFLPPQCSLEQSAHRVSLARPPRLLPAAPSLPTPQHAVHSTAGHLTAGHSCCRMLASPQPLTRHCPALQTSARRPSLTACMPSTTPATSRMLTRHGPVLVPIWLGACSRAWRADSLLAPCCLACQQACRRRDQAQHLLTLPLLDAPRCGPTRQATRTTCR